MPKCYTRKQEKRFESGGKKDSKAIFAVISPKTFTLLPKSGMCVADSLSKLLELKGPQALKVG